MFRLLSSFLKRFCAGNKGAWSTRRFGFLAAGFNYTIMSYISLSAFLWREQYDHVVEIVLLNAVVFVILALFVSTAGLGEVLGHYFKRKGIANENNN